MDRAHEYKFKVFANDEGYQVLSRWVLGAGEPDSVWAARRRLEQDVISAFQNYHNEVRVARASMEDVLGDLTQAIALEEEGTRTLKRAREVAEEDCNDNSG